MRCRICVLPLAAVFIAAVHSLAGCGAMNVTSPSTPAQPAAAAIVTQPANQTVSEGQTAMFSVNATGTPPLAFQWQKDGANIALAASATFTTPVTVAADSGEQFRVVVSNSAGSVTSSVATLTVNAVAPSSASNRDVVTYHYDNLRTGQNLQELTLTPKNVTQTKFGKLGSFAVDGRVDAQPLYLANLVIAPNVSKNVLYVVTEHGSVYAFDADSINGNTTAFLWMTSTLAAGEVTSDDRSCGQVTPEIGITSTPVIDRARNAIYVVAMSKDAAGVYMQRLHALDLTNGRELFGGPITITATFTRGATTVTFDPKQYKERPGLLELNGTIYTTWASHCDIKPYTSWVISYGAADLSQSGVLNLAPNGSDGGIWMAGAAPAADAAGNIYFIVGNGTFDISLDANGLPMNGNCGNCYAKISSTAPLKLLDYFTPLNTVAESNADTDFGSGGPLLLPDVMDSSGATRHLAIGSGKDANIYVVDRDAMGKFSPTQDNIYQQISGRLGTGGVFSKPSYFHGTVYYGAVNDFVQAFPITNGKLAGIPSSKSAATFAFPGATPAISASGTTNGIVWAIANGGTAILHAYDASNLSTELYNSSQAANGRDSFVGNKFITPMIVNGKVYVGTPNSVAVFGLLP